MQLELRATTTVKSMALTHLTKYDSVQESFNLSKIQTVLEIQRLLNTNHNLDLIEDGIAGSSTLNAIKWLGVPERDGLPRSNNAELIAYYGQPGTQLTKITVPYKMQLAWSLDTTITRFSCHPKIKESLEQVFEGILDHYGNDEIQRNGLSLFGGCYSKRRIRGGNRWSEHAFSCAVDLDPAHNRLRWDHTKARFAQPEYEAFWQIVEASGARSLGREKDFDWMHFSWVSG